MSIDLIKRLGIFVVLVLVQGLVFNHIHLFNCATPLLYIFMVLHFRRNHPRWSVMLWSFMMGLCIDVFANTPGVAAASMTFIGLLQPYLFELFVPRDSADDLEPSMRTIGVGLYVLYTLVIVLVYNLVFFTLETFNFFSMNVKLSSESIHKGNALITENKIQNITIIINPSRVRN